MAEIFGHRWTSAYGADPHKGAGETWGKGLAGLSVRDVARGVEACIGGSLAWPPTLPEFRELCMGIPTAAEVRLAVMRGTANGDGFTRLVWQHIDGFAFRSASREQAERMVNDAYAIARRHRMAGGDLPEPSPAIAAPEKKPYRAPTAEELAERKAKAAILAEEVRRLAE